MKKCSIITNETCDETDRDLERAVHRLYGVYKRRNPNIKQTHDFRVSCMVFNTILPLLKIIIGLVYIDKCPVNQYIPYYMFVGGIMQLLLVVTLIYRKRKKFLPFQLFLGLVYIIWFITATSSIFFEWEPDYYKTGSRYCAKTLYVFATFDCLAECVSVVLLGFFLCIMISFEQY